ncbi:TetR/AcrR family transcriptional regulator [Methylobacterium sp. E-045]|uniref:TetR/AcrR family transcriptional regulator n=1 Tax=Methylobacterium sp. E-045 TaxID=2836575 RepID=UPI0039194231
MIGPGLLRQGRSDITIMRTVSGCAEPSQKVEDPRPKSRGGRPTRHEEGLLTERLIETGGRLFIEYGFDNTSIERIAGEAGVSKRTFYSRFPTKSDLFTTFIFRWFDQGMAEIDASTRHVADAHAQQWLTVVGLQFLEFNLRFQTIEIHRVLVSASKTLPELSARVRQMYLVRVRHFVRDALERFHERGEIEIEDADFAAEMFFHSCIGYFRQRAMVGHIKPHIDAATRDEFSKTIAFFLHGCRVKQKGSGATGA